MQSIDFHQLPRSVQERFAACVAGHADPAPLLRSELRSRAPLMWAVLGVLSAIALALFCRHGFGDLNSPSSLHHGLTLAVYVAAVSALALSIVRLIGLRLAQTALPYARGVYMFPVTLVDARDAVIRVLSLSELGSIARSSGKPNTLELSFPDGEQFSFTLPSSEEVDRAITRAEAARDEALTLGNASHPRITVMFTLDPLQHGRMTSPLGRKESLSHRLPIWVRHAWIAAPIAGFVLGAPIRTLRNRASDERMFARAGEIGDVAAFRAYLVRGERHTSEVTNTLLPRAELREAAALGTVAAIDQFRAAHPGSAIGSEIDAARRTAMLADLEQSKKVGTIAAFHEFAKRHPDSGLEPELRDAMHALFAPALESFRRRVTDPEARSFVERVFAFSEVRAREGWPSSTVQIRFRRIPSHTMKKADKMVSEHNWFLGEVSYPSRYFDAAHSTARENALFDVLSKRMGEAMGSTVFTFVHGTPLDEPSETLPQVTVPTLFIAHGAEWPGLFDGSISNPRGIWITLAFPFQVTFVIPGDPKTLHFELEVKEPLAMSVIEANPKGGTPAMPFEEKLYDAMARDAYAQLATKCLATIGAKNSTTASAH